MKERSYIQFAIVVFWTFFWGLSVADKIIPAVQVHWVGKDFFALFVKFFESLGLKNPIFATIALASIAVIETINFAFYLFALVSFVKRNSDLAEKWFYRAILSSVMLFSLFSIGDNVFGDRSQLLEHGLFWMITVASWAIFKYIANSEEAMLNIRLLRPIKIVLSVGTILTGLTAFSIIRFSNHTFADVSSPVEGKEVVDGIYKFDMPFLADRVILQKTINTFKKKHPDLNVTYIYTGPSELNSKMKTFLLLYIFTEKKADQSQ